MDLNLNLGFGVFRGNERLNGMRYPINYLSSGGTFTFSTDANDKMELTNYGSGDAGLLYAGRAVELGATNDVDLPVLTGNAYITIMDDTNGVTQTATDSTVSSTYTLVDDTYRWAYANENPFSEADLTAIEVNPNKIVEFAMDGTGLTNTKGVDDKFYGFREENSGQHVIDALSSYGADQVKSGLTTANFGSAGATLAIVGDWLEATVTTALSRNMFTYLVDISNGATNIPNAPSDTVYVFQFEAYIDGTLEGAFQTISARFSPYFQTELTSTPTTYTFVGNITALSPYMSFNGTAGTGKVYFNLTNYTAREAAAAEIANYTDTIRTNVDQSPYGIQWTCAELDGAGVPTAYTDTELMTYDNDYIDTQWIPDDEEYSIEETVSGELQDFGNERIANGTFDTDTVWFKGGGWTISDGEAHCDGTQTANTVLYQGGCEGGKKYLIAVEITDISAGALQLVIGGTLFNIYTEVGKYTATVIAGSANPNFNFRGDPDFIGSIDNASAKELTTKTQRTEARVLTHSATETKYYIDTVEQDVTPPLPDDTTTLRLTNTAVIGYEDTIDEINYFRVSEKIIEP